MKVQLQPRDRPSNPRNETGLSDHVDPETSQTLVIPHVSSWLSAADASSSSEKKQG
jgi:hypothetical protein